MVEPWGAEQKASKWPDTAHKNGTGPHDIVYTYRVIITLLSDGGMTEFA